MRSSKNAWSYVVAGSLSLAAPGALFATETPNAAEKTAAPAADSVEKTLPPEPRPVPAPAAPARLAPSATQIIDDILSTDKARQEQNQRNALVLYEQAQAAVRAGKLSDAHRLSRRAAKLYPNHKPIAEFVSSLDKEISERPSANPAFARGRAHLAAAVTRGQTLMQAGRYAQGIDLLNGVMQAAVLFPETERLDMYTRLAQEALDRYQSAVDSGRITPEPAAGATPEPSPPIAATGAAAPTNLKRILRGGESQVPLWYATQKNRLAASMNVDYRKQPAALAFEDISKKTGIPFVVDRPLTESRAHLNTTVDLRVAEVPAEAILDLVCQKAGFEYVIMQRSVVITTPARALTYLQDLPNSLRHNWAAARVLFPEMNPELFADPATAGATAEEAENAEENVPSYLTSGKALIEHIQRLLR